MMIGRGRDWAGVAPPCRSPVAVHFCLSGAHGEKISMLAWDVKGRNEAFVAMHARFTKSLRQTTLSRLAVVDFTIPIE
jgi:hypothetical protein